MRRRKGLQFGLALIAAAALLVLIWYFLPFAQTVACEHSSDALGCVQSVLLKETEARGIGSAFATFRQLYAFDPAFSQNCHYETHAIGQGAYELYEKGESIAPQNEFSYCGFGFYHGFMISLLASTNDPQDAYRFCEQQASIETDTMHSCMHGFGHGISEFDQVTDWSDPLSVIAPELGICKRISTDVSQQSLCAGGVFNSLGEEFIAKWAADHSFTGIIDQSHPYAICEAQSYAPFRAGCFRDFNSVIAALSRDTFGIGAALVAEIPDQADAALAMENFSDYLARDLQNNTALIQAAAESCYKARPDLVASCIEGYAEGLLEFSTPGKEYLSAIAFCAAPQLRDADRDACFKTIVDSSEHSPAATFRAMCAALPRSEANLCVASSSPSRQ